MFKAYKYTFVKSADYMACYHLNTDTIRISLDSIYSFQSLMDSIIHEEIHRALFIAGLSNTHHHKAIQILEANFFSFKGDNNG